MHCLARDERGDRDGKGGRKRSRMVNRGGGWKKSDEEKERRATDARKCPDVNAINLLGTLHFNIYPKNALSLTSFLFSPSSSSHLFLRPRFSRARLTFSRDSSSNLILFLVPRTFSRSLFSSFFAFIYPGGIVRDESCASKVGYNNSLPRGLRSQ